MSIKKRNLSLENTKNKIFLPSIFNNDQDVNMNMDPKLYLQMILNKTTRTQRAKSLQFYNQIKQQQKNEPIQVKYKLETDKDIVFAFEDQFSYKDKQQYTNKLQIKVAQHKQIKEVKYKELVNCYCQKFAKKKPSSNLKHTKLNLEFL
ncbi:unnamed protein product (macronuclear) [Paramecium tetraurelia]|uniref:Uncharacterized protein n=1 Tax=Paramecium tetraurelia TaxID=5888 RepID=A0BRF3_PARTE|nr:uncharacterized protein GSPATT00031351001 [Paramecium tetraurelia]CAK61120.1 unnamed protein product [Paramecium tetraurelia]|eukprot:XP_001428518.1 hypothetical protein (macronuclear) [Paramecium tetraurelia strain d4-2]